MTDLGWSGVVDSNVLSILGTHHFNEIISIVRIMEFFKNPAFKELLSFLHSTMVGVVFSFMEGEYVT